MYAIKSIIIKYNNVENEKKDVNYFFGLDNEN